MLFEASDLNLEKPKREFEFGLPIYPFSSVLIYIHDKTDTFWPNGSNADHPLWQSCSCNFSNWIRERLEYEMTDSIYLSGPEANVEKAFAESERNKARKMDKSTIEEKLAKAFCYPPEKTIDNMSDEEVIQHAYNLEELIRVFRLHLMETSNEKSRRRQKAGTKVFDALDMNYKPKPVPLSRQANDEDEKLARKLAERKGVSFEEALSTIKGK